jgi:hypothetical protein
MAGASFDLHVDLDPPHALVTVDAISADDRFLSGLESTLQVIDPEKPAHPLEVPLTETAAGHYEARLALDRYGSFLLRSVHKQGGSEVAVAAGTVSLPYPREYLALPPDEAALARLAEVTGGRVRPTAAQLFDPGADAVRFRRPLWSWPLWAAALLLLVDVALRRLRLFRR